MHWLVRSLCKWTDCLIDSVRNNLFILSVTFGPITKISQEHPKTNRVVFVHIILLLSCLYVTLETTRYLNQNLGITNLTRFCIVKKGCEPLHINYKKILVYFCIFKILAKNIKCPQECWKECRKEWSEKECWYFQR